MHTLQDVRRQLACEQKLCAGLKEEFGSQNLPDCRNGRRCRANFSTYFCRRCVAYAPFRLATARLHLTWVKHLRVGDLNQLHSQ